MQVGLSYDKGEAVPQDHAEAVKWYRKAAEQGLDFAQYNLGVVYSEGEGVPQDHAEAAKWWHRAAAQGFVSAQSKLGLMYATGQGVPMDYVLAYMWLNLAAAQGNQAAINGRELVVELMTPADISKAQRLARKWMEKHGK